MSNGTLRTRAYQHIQNKILSGEFLAGQRISEQALAEEIGISRTPVRSAIRQLESEGLLDQVPRFGTIVKKLDHRELSELYDMRVALEGFGAEVAAGCITPEDIGLLTTLCGQMQVDVEEQRSARTIDDPETVGRFVDADMQFHLIILRATGNRRLMKSVAGSRMLSQWGGFARKQQDSRLLAGAWNQHLQILNGLKQGDAEQARQQMVDHIRFSKTLALTLFDRLQAEGDAAEVMQWATPLQGPSK